ncbi:MAG: EamA family transporter, partial [Clostridia bacterium]|nr:EamA family transporter [Clostridia bacterium]
MKNKQGHLAALVTVVIWGTTFISTKLLLAELAPLSILVIRFVIGYAALMIVCPHRLRGVTVRQEAAFAAAGLCGICLYYLLENV